MVRHEGAKMFRPLCIGSKDVRHKAEFGLTRLEDFANIGRELVFGFFTETRRTRPHIHESLLPISEESPCLR